MSVGPPPSRAFSIARCRLAVDGENVGPVDDDPLEAVGGRRSAMFSHAYSRWVGVE